MTNYSNKDNQLDNYNEELELYDFKEKNHNSCSTIMIFLLIIILMMIF
jgi:hypothetical protein